MLEENIKLRSKAENKFQSFFDREVNKLRNDFRNESEVGLFLFFPPFLISNDNIGAREGG